MGEATGKTTGASADWSELTKQYAAVQQVAYTTKKADHSEVLKLQDQLNAYVDTHVTDEAQKTAMKATIATDVGSMAEATKTNEGTKESDKAWDTARTDLEAMFAELAPEGGDAVWTPTTASATDAPQLNALAKTTTADVGSTSGASAAAGTFGGVSMVSLDDMVSKFPQLAPYKDLFNSMGAKYNVPPQLLAAQAMQESHANPSEGNGGMMQFSNTDTWKAFGDASIDTSSFNESNVSAQVEGAAKYDAHLLSNHGGDLNQALLEYSGGLDFYPTGIKKWMSGVDGYSG